MLGLGCVIALPEQLYVFFSRVHPRRQVSPAHDPVKSRASLPRAPYTIVLQQQPEHCPLCADEAAVLVHPSGAAQQQPGAGQDHIVSIFSQVNSSCTLCTCCILQRAVPSWSVLPCLRKNCRALAVGLQSLQTRIIRSCSACTPRRCIPEL